MSRPRLTIDVFPPLNQDQYPVERKMDIDIDQVSYYSKCHTGRNLDKGFDVLSGHAVAPEPKLSAVSCFIYVEFDM